MESGYQKLKNKVNELKKFNEERLTYERRLRYQIKQLNEKIYELEERLKRYEKKN